MGHSFLYSRNFMFSRNALFWKVTGSKKLTIKTSHIWDISDPSESRSLKLYLVNYQNQDQGSIYEKKKITFSFSSTKDPWGLDFKQLRDQAGLYEEAGMAMNALWEVRNFSFWNPIYDCWQAPYSVDTFFFIGATLVSYLLLKVFRKIYIQKYLIDI